MRGTIWRSRRPASVASICRWSTADVGETESAGAGSPRRPGARGGSTEEAGGQEHTHRVLALSVHSPCPPCLRGEYDLPVGMNLLDNISQLATCRAEGG